MVISRIVKLLLTKILFGLLFFFLLFLFLAEIAPGNTEAFHGYLRSLTPEFYEHGNTECEACITEKGIVIQFTSWLREMFSPQHDWGLRRARDGFVLNDIAVHLPYTIVLLLMTVFSILIVSTLLSYLFTSNQPEWLKNSIEWLLEIISAFPEWLLCFIAIVSLRGLIPSDYLQFPADFHPQNFHDYLKIAQFFLIPVIVLTFAGGSVSVFTKYLVNRINNIKKSQYYIFLESNGVRMRYLLRIIIKEAIPLISRIISTKLPLIIGCSIVIELIFSVKGMGWRAYRDFVNLDNGIVLAVFFVVYISTFIADLLSEIIDLLSTPERNRTR